MPDPYPEGNNATAHTIRLIKAQALRDTAEELRELRQRSFTPGLRVAIFVLEEVAHELEHHNPTT